MKLNCPTTKILGPPGTGKTTTLLKILENDVIPNTEPRKIVYTSYTRTGVFNARDRACASFGLNERDFPYFATMHSICLRHQNRVPMMEYTDWIALGKRLRTSFTFTTRATETGGFKTKGDAYRDVYDYQRKVGCGLDEAKFTIAPSIPINHVQYFIDTYKEYKAVKGKMDFTDQLSNFLDSSFHLEVDYIICDEVQDFFPLQWEVLQKFSINAKHVYVAGDDDQCIHAWSGSRAEDLIDLEGTEVVLPKSYRLSPEIKERADRIITNVSKRIKKEYASETHTGIITSYKDPINLPITETGKESWLLLSRNWKFTERFRDLCDLKCLLYEVVGADGGDRRNGGRVSTTDIFRGINTWKKLNEGQQILAIDAKVLYRILPTKTRIKNGFKKIMEEMEDYSLLNMSDLVNSYGLLFDKASWVDAFKGLPSHTIQKFKTAEEHGELEHENVRIKISSIHSAKGMEADNVAIDYTMSPNTWKSYLKNKDNEHRVAYVGVTRAIKHLHIVSPITNQFYNL